MCRSTARRDEFFLCFDTILTCFAESFGGGGGGKYYLTRGSWVSDGECCGGALHRMQFVFESIESINQLNHPKLVCHELEFIFSKFF